MAAVAAVAAAALKITILTRDKMIRYADMRDFDRIMEMMINFANHAPVVDYHDPEYNDRGVRNFLTGVLQNGCIIVGEVDDVIQGMIVAQICTDPWLPHIKTLKELAWWVEEEYRNTSLGYKLLMKYVETGKKMQSAGVIKNFILTNMSISPDFDLGKRGWRAIETNYVYEGA
jgi:hypothetical protein